MNPDVLLTALLPITVGLSLIPVSVLVEWWWAGWKLRRRARARRRLRAERKDDVALFLRKASAPH